MLQQYCEMLNTILIPDFGAEDVSFSRPRLTLVLLAPLPTSKLPLAQDYTSAAASSSSCNVVISCMMARMLFPPFVIHMSTL